MHINATLFNFKKNELYYGKEKTGTKIVVDPNFSEMWWVVTEKGSSHDFYNRARAKDHAMTLTTIDMQKIV